MKNSLFILLSVAFLLSGCASDGGFLSGDDYKRYADAKATHSINDSARISAQSGAIAEIAKEVMKNASTPTEKTLVGVVAMMQIDRLQPTQLVLEAPVTGYGVLKDLVGYTPVAIATGGMYGLGLAGIENAGKIVIGAGANISNSLNHTNINPLSVDGSIAYTGTAPAQVIDPVIVQVPAQ